MKSWLCPGVHYACGAASLLMTLTAIELMLRGMMKTQPHLRSNLLSQT